MASTAVPNFQPANQVGARMALLYPSRPYSTIRHAESHDRRLPGGLLSFLASCPAIGKRKIQLFGSNRCLHRNLEIGADLD